MLSRKSRLSRGLIALILLAIGLCLPTEDLPEKPGAAEPPFGWNRDGLFRSLEKEFRSARSTSVATARQRFSSLRAEGETILTDLAITPDATLERLEPVMFRLGALAAAHDELLGEFDAFVAKARSAVRPLSRDASEETFRRIYRVLYGGRAALEEAMVQNDADALQALEVFAEVAAATPSARVAGVRVHSGDIVLSRGGAPTSALISRGSDFPGNFSHAALIHVAETGEVSVVESLIEHGVVITPLANYLDDTKLRLLLLRLDPERLGDDPHLPHRAATAVFERARAGHIPYDFTMDWGDESAWFCSEVPYHAYRRKGIELWEFKSAMSARGLARWLAGLGVRHFTTLVPSAIEYDWQLRPVAEWRNPKTVRDDRIDNAVLDALLEEADRGLPLDYAWYKLPLARLAKGWSLIAEPLGLHKPIPEGMSAAQALRVQRLVDDYHPTVRNRLEQAASDWRRTHGYPPPYWQLYRLARKAAEKMRHGNRMI